MNIYLCISYKPGNFLKLKNLVKRSQSYVDKIYILNEGRQDQAVYRWAKDKKYELIEIESESEEFSRRLMHLLTMKGAEFVLWLDSNDENTQIEEILIKNITNMKSGIHHKVWGEDEICYFANFSGPSFEKWSPKSLSHGIGGSELSVVELSKRWAREGYKVTVYGDPRDDRGEYDGVLYLPWYEFNKNDYFNIFIHWRGAKNAQMARYIKSRKYYLELHDVWEEADVLAHIEYIDKIMVKSRYHRFFGERIEDEKFEVIGNGV